MGLENAFLSETFSPGNLFPFGNKRSFKKWRNKIFDFELRIWEVYLNRPRFITARPFLRNRLNIEIYTDARARSPSGKDVISWVSGVAAGRILIITGNVYGYSSM